MAVGSSQRGSSIGSSNRGSTINEGWVSLGFSLTLGNDVSVVETAISSDKRGGSIGSSIGGQRGSTIAICGLGEPTGSMSIWVSTIGGEVLSISSGFRLSHSSGGKSENYKLKYTISKSSLAVCVCLTIFMLLEVVFRLSKEDCDVQVSSSAFIVIVETVRQTDRP